MNDIPRYFSEGHVVSVDLGRMSASHAARLVDFCSGYLVGASGWLFRAADRVIVLTPTGRNIEGCQLAPPKQVNDPNAQIDYWSHEIRIAEADLALAQRRRRWSNITLVLSPMYLLVVLFELYWVLRADATRLMAAIYIPAGLARDFMRPSRRPN